MPGADTVSGAMGGSASEEFLAPAPSGEDSFVQCTNCDYTANTEAVEIAVPDPVEPANHPAMKVLDTPDTPTIETLVAYALANLAVLDEPFGVWAGLSGLFCLVNDRLHATGAGMHVFHCLASIVLTVVPSVFWICETTWGSMITPPFATPSATSAISRGVTVTSP